MENEQSKNFFFSKLIFALFILLCGCSYQWGQGGFAEEYGTISIPYVYNDADGTLTAAIIKEMCETGTLEYRPEAGALILKATVSNEYDEDISFRYDHKSNGHLRKSVVPDETRVSMTVEMSLIEAASGQILLGPVLLTAETEFDHDYYSGRAGSIAFSLGQLTNIDEARDAAQTPLNRRLAQTIVDYINSNW